MAWLLHPRRYDHFNRFYPMSNMFLSGLGKFSYRYQFSENSVVPHAFGKKPSFRKYHNFLLWFHHRIKIVQLYNNIILQIQFHKIYVFYLHLLTWNWPQRIVWHNKNYNNSIINQINLHNFYSERSFLRIFFQLVANETIHRNVHDHHGNQLCNYGD